MTWSRYHAFWTALTAHAIRDVRLPCRGAAGHAIGVGIVLGLKGIGAL